MRINSRSQSCLSLSNSDGSVSASASSSACLGKSRASRSLRTPPCGVFAMAKVELRYFPQSFLAEKLDQKDVVLRISETQSEANQARWSAEEQEEVYEELAKLEATWMYCCIYKTLALKESSVLFRLRARNRSSSWPAYLLRIKERDPYERVAHQKKIITHG